MVWGGDGVVVVVIMGFCDVCGVGGVGVDFVICVVGSNVVFFYSCVCLNWYGLIWKYGFNMCC